MQDEELSPHVDEIMEAVGDKVSREQVLEELKKYVTVFRLNLPTAKRTVVKKFGGASESFPASNTRKLEAVGPGEMSVSFIGKVLSINEKEIESQGARKKIFYGLIGDETAVLPYTAWETMDLKIERGWVVSVRNAYTTEYQGRVQLNFGTRTGIKRDESTDIKVETIPSAPAKPLKIGQIGENSGRVEVTGRILSIEKRMVSGENGPREIFNGMIADETGRIRFTSWGDTRLKQGDVVKINSVYAKAWKGIPQISFDEKSEITRVKGVFPSSEQLSALKTVEISSLVEGSGAADVTVNGMILQIKEGSGLVFRCPECKRVLQKGTCRIHGKVEGTADLRIKAVVDDGTGAISVVMNRGITEELLEMGIDDCIEKAREVMDYDVVRDLLADRLIAKPIEITGNVTVDEYGPMMIAQGARGMDIKVKDKAEKLLLQLEESE
jgi:replication factor A1